jgi:hypothetical protein
LAHRSFPTNADAITAIVNQGIPGVQPRKQALVSMGATQWDLAIAFQETSNTQPTPLTAIPSQQYPYGDAKTQDSTNFSIFKLNWYTIRTACSQFSGRTVGDVAQGAVLNTNDRAAITCLHQAMAHFRSNFYAAQRYVMTLMLRMILPSKTGS